jgi:hypothetical protein
MQMVQQRTVIDEWLLTTSYVSPQELILGSALERH